MHWVSASKFHESSAKKESSVSNCAVNCLAFLLLKLLPDPLTVQPLAPRPSVPEVSSEKIRALVTQCQ